MQFLKILHLHEMYTAGKCLIPQYINNFSLTWTCILHVDRNQDAIAAAMRKSSVSISDSVHLR